MIKKANSQQIIVSTAIAVWVCILAFFQHVLLEVFGITGGWTFTAVIMFFAFMHSSENPLRDTLCGACTGILTGALILWSAPLFVPLVGAKWCSCIPVSIIIILIIVGGNIVPAFCNNTAFGYMILSTMQGSEKLLGQLPLHIILLIVMGLIAIKGTVWLQETLTKKLENKN